MRRHAIDRRLFLGASAMTLLGAAGAARAQAPQASKAGEAAAGTKPTARVADFIAGFELKHAPALAIERARTAFIDTVGVMLAGSRSEPAGIVLDEVTKGEHDARPRRQRRDRCDRVSRTGSAPRRS